MVSSLAELSSYQKKTQVTDLLQTLDNGHKGQLLEALLGEWDKKKRGCGMQRSLSSIKTQTLQSSRK